MIDSRESAGILVDVDGRTVGRVGGPELLQVDLQVTLVDALSLPGRLQVFEETLLGPIL
jgi:hypothetical protein